MSHKKLPMALAAVGTAIVIVAVIAAAAGIFSGQDTKENITDLQASGQERISDTNGYKAMREYYEYLHSLSEEELETVIDTSETAVYEAPAKIKELCEKYQLKYAAKETELLSWDAVETAMMEKQLEDVLSDDLTAALKAAADDYGGGYTFDDGNLYLELEQQDDKNNIFMGLGFSPEESFPWQGYSAAVILDEINEAESFDCQVDGKYQFAGFMTSSGGIAFGKVGNYCFSMSVTDLSDYEQKTKLTKEDMESYLSQIDFSKML